MNPESSLEGPNKNRFEKRERALVNPSNKEGIVVKSLKIALWSSLFCIVAVLLLCTIKNDNGNLAVTGPNTVNKNPAPSVPPVLIISADSSYVGLKDTLNIIVKAMTDSTLTRASVNSLVACSVTGGYLNKDTVFTDSNGRAVVRFTDSMSAQITFTATCFGLSLIHI